MPSHSQRAADLHAAMAALYLGASLARTKLCGCFGRLFGYPGHITNHHHCSFLRPFQWNQKMLFTSLHYWTLRAQKRYRTRTYCLSSCFRRDWTTFKLQSLRWSNLELANQTNDRCWNKWTLWHLLSGIPCPRRASNSDLGWGWQLGLSGCAHPVHRKVHVIHESWPASMRSYHVLDCWWTIPVLKVWRWYIKYLNMKGWNMHMTYNQSCPPELSPKNMFNSISQSTIHGESQAHQMSILRNTLGSNQLSLPAQGRIVLSLGYIFPFQTTRILSCCLNNNQYMVTSCYIRSSWKTPVNN